MAHSHDQIGLFCAPDSQHERHHLPMPEADVILYENFFLSSESQMMFDELLQETQWQQDKIKLYGKEVKLPRLTACYGDAPKDYSYSGLAMPHRPWTPILSKIKRKIEVAADVSFNSVLLNLYRDGKSRLSWHQDNEPELGPDPIIGSVSFGEARRFQFKHKYKRELGIVNVTLTNGSFLLMKGTTQRFWLHQVPATSKPIGPRINLTFRLIR